MRSIHLRFESPAGLAAILADQDGAHELPAPAAAEVADGEWVLVELELASDRRALTATAAVGCRRGDHTVLCFEEREWEHVEHLTAPPSGRGSSSHPSARPTAPSTAPEESDEAPPRSLRTPGIRIALVDHDASTLAELNDTLRSQGLDVVPFASESAALAERGPLHAAVVNFALPGEGARALAQKLRADRPGRLPVLFVSSKRCPREIVQAYACGCDDYLARPFRGAELGARVLGMLRRSLDAYR